MTLAALRFPIVDLKPGYSAKLAQVVRNQRHVACSANCSNHQIVWPDQFSPS
jgi:hypothetical protein